MPGVRRHEDLVCYQLAVEVRRYVLRLTRRERVRRDYKFLHQIRDAARSAPRNIAEGYARFIPTEILRYLSYATGSLEEVKNHIQDGFEDGYFSQDERDAVISLAKRCLGAIARWTRYLESPSARRFYERHKHDRRNSEYEPRTKNLRT